ncbi:MAG: hypothetical protein K8H88_17985 [Sandaracinaceae bacterium]|nr:hypothetical protein [Sandaracinaceae bacterium]
MDGLGARLLVLLSTSLLAAGGCAPVRPSMVDLRDGTECGRYCNAAGFWSEVTPIDPEGDPEAQPQWSVYRFFFTGSAVAVHVQNVEARPRANADESYYICRTRWREEDDLLQCEWSQGEWIDIAFYDRTRDVFYVRAQNGQRFEFERERSLTDLSLPHAILLRVFMQVGVPADGEGHVYLPRGTDPRPQVQAYQE